MARHGRRRINRHLGRVALAILGAFSASAAQAQERTAPWELHLMPWQTHAGQPRPWRTDPRIAGRSEPDYPDDFQVWFANPDSTRKVPAEVMWARITAYDTATDLFLGILLNQPNNFPSLRANDNVVFRFDPKLKYLTAVGAPNYADAGWPASMSNELGVVLRDGIRAYRAGNNGHNMPEIERCISVLSSPISAAVASGTPDQRFVFHFVLGRCLAEKYETQRAITEFKEAIAISPDDVDAHMALLAELSILTHRSLPTSVSADDQRWENEFVDELALVRRRFPAENDVNRMMSLVFDPSGGEKQPPAALPKLRRIGYAFFRWKRR